LQDEKLSHVIPQQQHNSDSILRVQNSNGLAYFISKPYQPVLQILMTFISEAKSSVYRGHISNFCAENIKLELLTKAIGQRGSLTNINGC